MNLYKPTPAGIDPQILAIASLTDLPTQPFSLRSPNSILGKQVQQIKTVQQPPKVNTTFPINIYRRGTSGGLATVSVQFIAPTNNQNYQATQISLQSAQGTQTLGAAGGSGPLVFTTPFTSAPTKLVVQQTNSTGAVSTNTTGAGGRALNLLPSQ
jgi:hypothetical protein